MGKEQLAALKMWIEHCLAHSGEATLDWTEFRALQKARMLPVATYEQDEFGVMARRVA